MRGLHNRVRRLEQAVPVDLGELTDAELDWRLALLLAPVLDKPAEEIQAAIPEWSADGTLRSLVARVAAHTPKPLDRPLEET